VLGGGVVGVELAQAYSELGVKVSLVEAADRLVSREERFEAVELTAALHERGIEIAWARRRHGWFVSEGSSASSWTGAAASRARRSSGGRTSPLTGDLDSRRWGSSRVS
jgi:dihydrolipoamide dehydrogenase